MSARWRSRETGPEISRVRSVPEVSDAGDIGKWQRNCSSFPSVPSASPGTSTSSLLAPVQHSAQVYAQPQQVAVTIIHESEAVPVAVADQQVLGRVAGQIGPGHQPVADVPPVNSVDVASDYIVDIQPVAHSTSGPGQARTAAAENRKKICNEMRA